MYQTHLNFFSEIITPSTRIWKLHTTFKICSIWPFYDKVECGVPGVNVWSNIDKKTKSIRYIAQE